MRSTSAGSIEHQYPHPGNFTVLVQSLGSLWKLITQHRTDSRRLACLLEEHRISTSEIFAMNSNFPDAESMLYLRRDSLPNIHTFLNSVEGIQVIEGPVEVS